MFYFLKKKKINLIVGAPHYISEIYAELMTPSGNKATSKNHKTGENVLSEGPKQKPKTDRIFGKKDYKESKFNFGLTISIEGKFYFKFTTNEGTFRSNVFEVFPYERNKFAKQCIANQSALPRIKQVYSNPNVIQNTQFTIYIDGYNFEPINGTPKIQFGAYSVEYPDVVWENNLIKCTFRNGFPAGLYSIKVLFYGIAHLNNDYWNFEVLDMYSYDKKQFAELSPSELLQLKID